MNESIPSLLAFASNISTWGFLIIFSTFCGVSLYALLLRPDAIPSYNSINAPFDTLLIATVLSVLKTS